MVMYWELTLWVASNSRSPGSRGCYVRVCEKEEFSSENILEHNNNIIIIIKVCYIYIATSILLGLYQA